ncbi:MAG TPA: DUF501 domain-containing protein [Acidimicrobiia bacterium]|jgi:hypothetical protein|nr:DUF501 domain-containing protein [Acidimicrobiia bacterium]
MDDRGIVAAQLGREPRSTVEVVARCHLGVPVVIAVPPHLDDGTPFPTRYWLTCPLATRRIGRIESRGGVRAAEDRIAADPALAERFAAANDRYQRERDTLIGDDAPPHVPSGGVGGTQYGVKCLHAHYADFAAGNDNPVGEHTASEIEPLDCRTPCVAEIEGVVRRDPDWREPKR